MGPVDLSAAIARYPSLAGLHAVIGAGWKFREIRDDRGLTALYGNRQYLHMPHIVDAIKIRSETDATGLRGHNPEGVLWELSGSLLEVVDGLLGLPDPAAPHAPTLITGAAPQLWVPRS